MIVFIELCGPASSACEEFISELTFHQGEVHVMHYCNIGNQVENSLGVE